MESPDWTDSETCEKIRRLSLSQETDKFIGIAKVTGLYRKGSPVPRLEKLRVDGGVCWP